MPLEVKQKIELPGGEVYFWPGFFTPAESSCFLEALTTQINWRQDKMKMFGKELELPRLTAWYGDAGKGYQYSGIKNNPLPWIPVLTQIKEAVEEVSEKPFNSVLLNYYRHGQDSMGWHSDDEPELGTNPIIASVSFGQARRFDFRSKKGKSIPRQSVLLTSGSLLLMQDATQHNWQHQIAKSAKAMEPRINLTFRYIL